VRAQAIESTNLIPLHSDLVHLIRAAEDVNSVDDAIVRNLDIVLVATMTILYKLHQQLKESPFGGDASRQQRMQEYRAKARSLMTFAGMVSARFYHLGRYFSLTLSAHSSDTVSRAIPILN
jgi:nuclear pore complex protein Nup93